jgi:hypothetical protein
MDSNGADMTQVFSLFAVPSLTEVLRVPESGCSYLLLEGMEGPRITPTARADCPHAAVLSPVRRKQRLYLGALFAPERRVRLNGWPAPPCAFLGVRDQISFGSEHSYQVSLYLRPHCGSPLPEHLGQICPVCLNPIRLLPDGRECTVYVCPHCSAVIHDRAFLEGESEPVECMKLSPSCPSCHQPISRKEGYLYVPEP